MSFLKKPYIPNKKVTSVIASKDCPKSIFAALDELNIKVIKSVRNPDLDDGLSAHPDLQINIINDIAISADFCYEYYKDMLPKFNVIKAATRVFKGYPNDIVFNTVFINNTLYHNLKYTDKSILKIITENGYNLFNVNQGYTKCTTCILAENAVITEDEGLAKAYIANDIDVLLIAQGDVKLKGYPNGFLGGASFLIDKNTLAVCGNIKNHCDYNKIRNFAHTHKVDIISLADDEINDFGSIIPIFL